MKKELYEAGGHKLVAELQKVAAMPDLYHLHLTTEMSKSKKTPIRTLLSLTLNSDSLAKLGLVVDSAEVLGTQGQLLVPTESGTTVPIEAINEAMSKNKFTLIAPDGRMWFPNDLMLLLAIVAAMFRGDNLDFEPPEKH